MSVLVMYKRGVMLQGRHQGDLNQTMNAWLMLARHGDQYLISCCISRIMAMDFITVVMTDVPLVRQVWLYGYFKSQGTIKWEHVYLPPFRSHVELACHQNRVSGFICFPLIPCFSKSRLLLTHIGLKVTVSDISSSQSIEQTYPKCRQIRLVSKGP